MSPSARAKKERGGLTLADHLDALRSSDLKEVYAFWSGGDAPELPKRELVRQLIEVMTDEGAVYRRVRTLTRRAVDVLLRLLRRTDYRSDLPGLFRRMPGEEQVPLEYHEAEAGLKALARRGFLAEGVDRAFATHGRALYAVPLELGDLLTGLFREETRTVRSVLSLAGHTAALTATEREALRSRFHALPAAPGPEDVRSILGSNGTGNGSVGGGPRTNGDGGGAPALLASVEPAALASFLREALADDGGILLRAEYAGRSTGTPIPWDRKGWAQALEAAGVGTVARLALSDYGISCDDEALVLFGEVVEDALERYAPKEPDADEILRSGGDLVADLGLFLAQVRREPMRVTREGDVHKAGRRRVESGFVFRESAMAGAPEVWAEVRAAADHLGLVTVDKEGFLTCREGADKWSALPLEEKVQGLYRTALEQPGPRGRSLHQHELRTVVEDLLREAPSRWWAGESLAVAARHRYLASLDARKIKERHRDRFFSAYFSGRETLRDLLTDLHRSWIRTLFVLGLVDVAVKNDRPVAVRLSTLGGRILGAAVEGGSLTGLKPLLVSPDFEIVVLPEGDVSDVVHRLDGFAQRVKTGDVVHFRLTKESVEAAVAEGRPIEEFLTFLQARARSPVPQNVSYSLKDWAQGVAFGTLERGVVLCVRDAQVLNRALALPGMKALLLRRLSPTEALLRDEPTDRRVLADLRSEGIWLRGG